MVAIIAIGAYYYPGAKNIVQNSFGGTTNYDTVSVNGLALGTGCNTGGASCNGTTFSRFNGSTCFIKAYATTIAASTTANVDCQGTAAIGTITGTASALTGVTDGDNVQVTLSTTTAGTQSNGIAIIGAGASTTAGYITLRISNLTGAIFTWPTTGNATGTVYYWVYR